MYTHNHICQVVVLVKITSCQYYELVYEADYKQKKLKMIEYNTVRFACNHIVGCDTIAFASSMRRRHYLE
jgi:hypothetical protein